MIDSDSKVDNNKTEKSNYKKRKNQLKITKSKNLVQPHDFSNKFGNIK